MPLLRLMAATPITNPPSTSSRGWIIVEIANFFEPI